MSAGLVVGGVQKIAYEQIGGFDTDIQQVAATGGFVV
jgi:hypothetical protein